MHILQAHGRPGRIFGQPALFFCPVHVRFFTDRICLVDPTPQRATWLRAVIRLLVQPYCRRSALLAFLGGTCEGEVCACDVCLRSGGGLQAAAPTRSVTPVQGLAAALAAAAAAVSELASTELVCAPEVVDGRAAAIMLLSALESEIGSGSGQPTVRQLLTKQERLLQSQLFQSRTNYAALVLTLIGEGLLSLELSPRLKGKGSTARVAPASSWREQLVIVSRPLLVTVLREHSEPPQAAAAAAAAAQGPEDTAATARQCAAELEQSLRATLRVQQNAQVDAQALFWQLLRVCAREGLSAPALSNREVVQCLRPTRRLQVDAATQVEVPDAREAQPSQRSQPARLRSPGELAFIHGSPARSSGPRRSLGSSPLDYGKPLWADRHMGSRHRPSWKKLREGRSPDVSVMRSLNMN